MIRTVLTPFRNNSKSDAVCDWVLKVREFNKAFNIKAPTFNFSEIDMQFKLVDEEIKELYDNFSYSSINDPNNPEVLDAIADSIYVLIGLAEKLGYDLTGAFAEVHRSNMSKLGEDGKPIFRSDGKIMKGPHYFKPDLKSFLK
jgi:NTP pyrophosphatase (non-canonical NTP hydrolase)